MAHKGASDIRKYFRLPAGFDARLTLILFLVSLAATLCLWGITDQFNRRLAIEQNKLRAESALRQAEIWVGAFLTNYAQSLMIISESANFRQAIGQPSLASTISQDFQAWLRAKPTIAQLRYIDRDGAEVIRVDRIGEAIELFDESRLQDKSSRYYFQTTVDLPRDTLYLSPIDLNVEFERIETPWRPMVRMAMPIYRSDAEVAGILIANVNAGGFLQAIETLGGPLGHPIEILNSEGYWLAGASPGRLWGFMFDNDMTLAKADPALWSTLQASPSGAAMSDDTQTVYSSLSLPALLEERSTFESIVAGDPDLHLLIRYSATPGFFSTENLPGFAALIAICGLFSVFTGTMLTARKSAEEKARAAEEQVVRLDRLAGLGALVAGVSHELNTPIGNALIAATTVDHRVQSLEQSIKEGRIGRNALSTQLANIRDGVSIMNGSLLRASEIIKNFKQFAVDQTSERRRKFILDAYLRETLHLLQPQFSNSGITLKEGHLERIEMDSFPGPVGQIVTNLLTNARIHAFKGRPHGTVVVSAESVDPDHVTITVSDDGSGIAPEELQQVLVPFFSTSFGEGGSGLGLTIVDSIVTGVLGGKLSIDSKPGEGTRITLLIPVVAPEDAARLAFDPGESHAKRQ